MPPPLNISHLLYLKNPEVKKPLWVFSGTARFFSLSHRDTRRFFMCLGRKKFSTLKIPVNIFALCDFSDSYDQPFNILYDFRFLILKRAPTLDAVAL